jgi:hypothetical protein
MTQKLVCARQFNPALFMGESWSAAEEDERAERLAEVDVSAITLVSCLKKDDELPTGEHCVNLLKETAYVRLGGRAFLGLWEHQGAIPEKLEGAAHLCVLRRSDSEAPQRQPLLALPLVARRSMALVFGLAWQHSVGQ